MTKTELMENYTAEQLAEMVLELTWKMWTNSEECKSIPPKVSIIVKCPDCGKPNKIELDEKSECLIRNKLTDRVHELQSEVEKYRKAFENAKKERDQQVAEYRKKIDDLEHDLKTAGEKIQDLVGENMKLQCERNDYKSKSEFLEVERIGVKKNEFSDFLPTEPIKVADMLINAEGEYEHNPIVKKICGTDKGAYRIFDVSELRQIAEHLFVYCNHHEEAQE